MKSTTLTCLASLVLILLVAAPLFSQTATTYPAVGQKWQQALGYVPGTLTAITAVDSLLGGVWLSNPSGGSVTVTITDNSTACGGTVCQIWGTITVAANSIASFSFGGLQAVGGVKWSASAGTTLVGWMWGNYTTTQISGLRGPAAAPNPESQPEAIESRFPVLGLKARAFRMLYLP